MPAFSWSLTVEPAPPSSAGVALTPDQLAGASAYRDLALDDDGDLYLDENGDLAGVSGVDGIASDLRSRLQTFLGEYTWNTAIGLPWLQEILGERPPRSRIEELVRTEALKTPGVISIDDFTATGSGRTLAVTFRASTDLGQVITASLLAQQSEEG
jgi:hypothetical protein